MGSPQDAPRRRSRRLSARALLVAALAVAWSAGPARSLPALAGPELEEGGAAAPRRTSTASPRQRAGSAATGEAGRGAALGAVVQAQVAQQISDQQQAVATAAASVSAKLEGASQLRAARARLAYRISQPRAPTEDEMATVRSRAAVKWLLARDRAEVTMLLEEQTLLSASAARLSAAALRVDHLEVPPRGLPWPAPGSVARGFGSFEHERSGTTLTRRGLDLEVDERAVARAVASGTVAYAGPIRGLDLGVLIDHGSYYSLIAKLTDLTVVADQPIEASAALGRAARRRLYFELRIKLLPAGIPIDPAPFLAPR